MRASIRTNRLIPLFVSALLALTACGGGGGGDTPSAKEQAIEKITAYAADGSNSAPTLQDYIDAGVTGVTTDNLAELNTVVDGLEAEDVDTTAELDALIAQLGINIKPTSNAGEDKTIQVNQSITLTGIGTDTDGTVIDYEWKKGSTVLATTASFDYTPTTVGTDTLTFTVTDNDGDSGSDMVDIVVTAAPIANQAPTADAGANKSVQVNQTITIVGTATDTDGSIASYEWKKGSTVLATTASFDYTPTTVGTDTLTLTVIDNDGESASDTVDILVTAVPDSIPPVITILGDNPVTIQQGTTYTDAGATAVDGVDGNVTVTSSGTVDTSTAGEYTITYTASDSVGNSATETRVVNVSSLQKLSDATIVYNESPDLNKELIITLEEITPNNIKYSWSILSQPDNSTLELVSSSDGKSATCTPTVEGEYRLKIVSPNGEEKFDTFNVTEVPLFDEDQIEGNDGSKNIEEISGIIKNQYWIKSLLLSKDQLEGIIAKYPTFTSINYNEVNGVLVESNGIEKDIKKSIRLLELEEGINAVNQRTFTGEKIDTDFKLPDDGSSFNDLGDNWHLEFINMEEAWDITTGSKDILVGLADGGFYSKHDDLKGKFEKKYTDSRATHGTGVSGTIAGITDNKEGISGINWISKLVVNSYKSDCKNDIPSNYTKILKYSEKVKVINSSWGCMGNKSGTIKKGVEKTRTFRNVATSYPNKLHIWAAGNDGANANTQNGALHLNKDGSDGRLSNVIVVTAVLKDNKLAAYSDYGQTVDIAAPTEFKSTKDYFLDFDFYFEAGNVDEYGTNWSGGFNGTSAATPVVTGVASLIYSLMPELSANDVKSILIKSSTSKVSERYTDDDITTEDFTLKVNGSHPAIPVLDAKAALEMTKDIKDGKIVKVTHSFPDPFKAETKVVVSSANIKLNTAKFDYILSRKTSESGGIGIFEDVDSGSVLGDSILLPIDSEHKDFNIRYKKGVEFEGLSVLSKYSYDFIVPKTALSVQDSTTLIPIPNAIVIIEPMFANISLSFLKKTGATNDKGKADLYLIPGKYKFIVTADGYPKSTKIVYISGKTENNVKVTIGDVGNLGGTVLDSSGNPISGALVRLSGGLQTNGVFMSAITDTSGTYHLSNINKRDSEGNLISEFTLSVSAQGFKEFIEENVVIINASSVNYNFTLMEKSLDETILYSNSFEQNESSWNATGLWHEQSLTSETGLFNTLVDGGFVSMPGDETTDHAYLPKAFDGDIAIWYGLADTGSFIVTQASGDAQKSGGTSTSANSGTITSPLIDLGTSTNPILRFNSWWEIEGVNPNASGFDLLDIKIAVGDGEFIALKRLNPFVDPSDSDRASKNYSTGGFNRKPIWTLEEIDLTEYAGKSVHIQFSFDTKDALYNGFRGWFVDNILIIDGSPQQSSGAKLLAKKLKSTLTTTPSIFNGMSKNYIETHKKPQKVIFGYSER